MREARGGTRGAQRHSERAPRLMAVRFAFFSPPLWVNSEDEKLLCLMCHISKTGHQ